MKFFEWSIIGKSYTSKKYENSGIVNIVKIPNGQENETSEITQNVKCLEIFLTGCFVMVQDGPNVPKGT